MPTNTPEYGDPLTPRETQILRLRGEGLMSKDIAMRLFIERRTVSFHCQNAYTKLGAHNIIQALRAIEKEGIVL